MIAESKYVRKASKTANMAYRAADTSCPCDTPKDMPRLLNGAESSDNDDWSSSGGSNDGFIEVSTERSAAGVAYAAKTTLADLGDACRLCPTDVLVIPNTPTAYVPVVQDEPAADVPVIQDDQDVPVVQDEPAEDVPVIQGDPLNGDAEVTGLYAADWSLTGPTLYADTSSDEGFVFAARSSDQTDSMDEDIEFISVPERCQSFTIGQEDVKMTLGAHRGCTYSEILRKDPKYHEELELAYKGKKIPKYVQGYLDWFYATTKTEKAMPNRTKVYPKAERKDTPCAKGCEHFTRHGSNQYIQKFMCLDCGHGEEKKVENKPTHDPNTCTHDDVDKRGSSKKVTMFWCKQCCQFIDSRMRANVVESRKVAEKLSVGTTTQQRLAKAVLNEQTLDKEEAAQCFRLFQKKLERRIQD